MSKETLSKFLTKNGLLLRTPRRPRGEPKEVVAEPIQKLIPRVSDLHSPSGRPDSWEPTRQEKKLLLDSRPEIFDTEKPERRSRGRRGGRGKGGSKARNVIISCTISAEEDKIIQAYLKETDKGMSETVRIALFQLMGKCIPARRV